MNSQTGFINPILNFNKFCIQHSHSIICWFSKMKFCIIQTWGSTQPSVLLWTPEFYTCFCLCQNIHVI